jgi:hypothetical protein
VGINHFVSYGSMRGNDNLPYTATAKMTFEQRLPDGNEIQGYIYTHQARDSAGRTMSEVGQGCRLDADRVPQPQLNVSVFDPAAKTLISWQVGLDTDKVVRVSHQRDVQPKMWTHEELATLRKSAESRQPPRSEFTSENLGIRTIAGVEARGERTTRTVPAEEEGNKLPLVIISETWTSNELGLVVLAISDDPRRGRTTYEVEELSRDEPDLSLFVPPKDYRIEDREAQTGSGLQP